jgi:hypothetical protein
MWIAPVGAAGSGHTGADNAIPASKLVAGTTAGNNDVVDFSASTNRPLRYSRRHLNTWFAFTPSTCGTRATLPRLKH